MIARRDLLLWTISGVGTFAGSAETVVAQQAPTPAKLIPPAFKSSSVVDSARELAKSGYKAPSADLGAPFANLNYEQYVGIRLKADSMTWLRDNVGFAIEPLPRGFIFSTPVAISVIEDGTAIPLQLTAGQFDFGKIPPPAPNMPVALSGFRVLRTHAGAAPLEVAIFQGASFMRAVATGQHLGIVSRALSIRTADPRGEDIPAIREVWIERPSLANDALIVYALIDSESMTGAYRFTVRPGDVTIVDTECTLFARSPVDNFGLGGMTAMFEFGAINRRAVDDVRSAVCEVSGLQMLNGKGEWIWRPVANHEMLQVSAFIDINPGGFGLLQRDRAFASYQDDDQHWELRPSLWIEPIADWGEGSVQLIEIPTDSETNDNIICFWRPKQMMEAGHEMAFAYRQFWCWTPPTHPTLATVTATRGGHGSAAKYRKFLVEFTGEMFADPAAVGIKAAASTSVGTITSLRSFHSKERKAVRVLFDLDPAGENLAELRLVLEANGKPASETWLYRWTA